MPESGTSAILPYASNQVGTINELNGDNTPKYDSLRMFFIQSFNPLKNDEYSISLCLKSFIQSGLLTDVYSHNGTNFTKNGTETTPPEKCRAELFVCLNSHFIEKCVYVILNDIMAQYNNTELTEAQRHDWYRKHGQLNDIRIKYQSFQYTTELLTILSYHLMN